MAHEDHSGIIASLPFLGSIALLLYNLYFIEKLAFSSGFYSALLLVSKLNSTIIAQEGITNISSQSAATILGMYVSYAMLPFALLCFGLSVLLMVGKSHSRILYLGLGFASIAAAIIATIINGTFNVSYQSMVFALPYIGITLVVLPSISLSMRSAHPNSSPQLRQLSINPDTPYTNMLLLSNRLAASLSGAIKILDMHLDQRGLENLYMIINGHEKNYGSISIIAKKDRLGKEFAAMFREFNAEMKRKGVEIELRILPEELTVEQHERLIIDDKSAYKIPPLNIINRKSEHIVKINRHEANERFESLWNRSQKFI
ncbi:MAG: hypothetical protein ACP5FR_00340 [Candidatus Micrarchaeia archaeon]